MAGVLEGKSALITGGIGRATALAFARESARVAVADLVAAAAEQTVASINQAGGQAMSLTGDITRADVVRESIAKVVATHGRLETARPTVQKAFNLYPGLRKFALTDPDLVALHLDSTQ